MTETSPLPSQRTRSSSHCPSSSGASTTTIDSSQKITTIDSTHKPTTNKIPTSSDRSNLNLLHQNVLDRSIQDDWMASTESDLMNIDEFKEKMARAKLWRGVKMDLKAYVARVRDESVSKKFEVEIKVIGRYRA